MTATSDLETLLATMDPRLKDDVYVFATVASLGDVDSDSEGSLLSVSLGNAQAAGFEAANKLAHSYGFCAESN